jgi:choice-of-anchor B domain-containing protein
MHRPGRKRIDAILGMTLIAAAVVPMRHACGIEPPPSPSRKSPEAQTPASYESPVPIELTSDESVVALGDDIYVNTGADRCSGVQVIPLPLGPSGEGRSVTVIGSAGGASGTDCGLVFSNVWWEGFEFDECVTVTFEFCGSFPHPQPRDVLASRCDEQGTQCNPFITAELVENYICPSGKEGSLRLRFRSLPPGVYYLPLGNPMSLNDQYQMRVTAEACTGDCSGCTGACCEAARRVCRDRVESDDCTAPGLRFSPRQFCESLECRPVGIEYDSDGVALVARVAVSEFSEGSTGANDIWGYVSPLGREYAVIGLTRSTGFVDITVPDEPFVVADIPDADSLWSDVKTFDQYAYNVNEFNGGLQVIDLTQIDAGVVSVATSLTTGTFRTAHNLFINEASEFLYLCGANSPTSGLIAVDLADPAQPVMTGIWTEHYVHDVYVRNFDICPYTARAGPCELAYAFGTNDGLFVIDVTDKTEMTTIGRLLYPTTAVCHQGWMTDDEKYILLNDEGDESRLDIPTTTYVIDVQDPSHPTLATSFTNGLPSIDHNLMIRGDLVFEANYSSGLRVYDISDVLNAHEIAYFDTYPADNRQSFNGAWGVHAHLPSGLILVSDRQGGLFVLRMCPNATLIPGDYDDDGDADLLDFARHQRCFGASGQLGSCERMDTNCDVRIDGRETTAFLSVPTPITP